MYIVRNKKTKNIIHKNPAPLRQALTPLQVYALFDAKTMEIGQIDGHLPEHYKIDENGQIIELTLAEKIDAGLITLDPGQKIVGDMVVEKTLSEKVAEGLITLEPDQKIIGTGIDEQIGVKTTEEKVAEGIITLSPDQKIMGTGENSRIEPKTISEKIAEGLLTLERTQKIIGEGLNEKIENKTVSEMVAEGIITLEKNQRLDGETIKTLTVREMFDEGLAALDEVKKERLAYFSDMAFAKRREIIPDYKQQNAALGIYDDEKTAAITATIVQFKKEFNRIKGLIEKAKKIKTIDAVKENFPKEIIKE